MADRAYSGKSFRKRAEEKGYKTVIPPKINYKESWEYDKEMYKGRDRKSTRLNSSHNA